MKRGEEKDFDDKEKKWRSGKKERNGSGRFDDKEKNVSVDTLRGKKRK